MGKSLLKQRNLHKYILRSDGNTDKWYMYIGTTLMVCRNALKDINETWYASCIYRLSD
jgi:hypothetical protein